jgi:hypothetical protein
MIKLLAFLLSAQVLCTFFQAVPASYRKKMESTNGSRLALGLSLAGILTTILQK